MPFASYLLCNQRNLDLSLVIPLVSQRDQGRFCYSGHVWREFKLNASLSKFILTQSARIFLFDKDEESLCYPAGIYCISLDLIADPPHGTVIIDFLCAVQGGPDRLNDMTCKRYYF